MTIDTATLKEHFDGDSELFEESRSMLVERVPEMLDGLKVAINASEFKEVEMVSHTLKGMISNFFDEELVGMLQRMESEAREQKPLSVESYNEITQQTSEFLIELAKVSV